MVRIIVSTVIVVLLGACGEEFIPSGPDEIEAISVHLFSTDTDTDYVHWNQYASRYFFSVAADMNRFEEVTAWEVSYGLEITNNIDEVIDGTQYVDIELYIQDRFNNWIDTLRYTSIDNDEIILYYPGKTYPIDIRNTLIWDQTKWDGESIHQLDSYKRYTLEQNIETRLNDNGIEQDYRVCDTVSITRFDTVPEYGIPIDVWAYARVKTMAEYEPVYSDTARITISYRFPYGFFDLAAGRCGEGWVFGDPVDP